MSHKVTVIHQLKGELQIITTRSALPEVTSSENVITTLGQNKNLLQRQNEIAKSVELLPRKTKGNPTRFGELVRRQHATDTEYMLRTYRNDTPNRMCKKIGKIMLTTFTNYNLFIQSTALMLSDMRVGLSQMFIILQAA